MLVNSPVTIKFHPDYVIGTIHSIEYVNDACVEAVFDIDSDDLRFSAFMTASNDRVYANFSFSFGGIPPYPIVSYQLSITRMPFSENNSVLARVTTTAA